MLDIIRFFADWKSDIQSDLPANHTLSVPTVLNWVYAVAFHFPLNKYRDHYSLCCNWSCNCSPGGSNY